MDYTCLSGFVDHIKELDGQRARKVSEVFYVGMTSLDKGFRKGIMIGI